jgi:ADP-ribose pyrophosphatase
MANTIEKRTRLFDGVKFSVDKVELTTRDGQRVAREAVVHPGAVVVLPILDDGRVVMIRNHRFVVGEELYELCAGTLEPNEDPTDCAGRELIEETGYEAGSIEPLCGFYTSPGFCNERIYAFVARDLKHVGQQLEATENIIVEPLPPTDVLAMTKDGRIRDGKTIATLLYHTTFSTGH